MTVDRCGSGVAAAHYHALPGAASHGTPRHRIARYRPGPDLRCGHLSRAGGKIFCRGIRAPQGERGPAAGPLAVGVFRVQRLWQSARPKKGCSGVRKAQAPRQKQATPPAKYLLVNSWETYHEPDAAT